MNVTITNLNEGEVLTLMRWISKHASNPSLTFAVSKDEL